MLTSRADKILHPVDRPCFDLPDMGASDAPLLNVLHLAKLSCLAIGQRTLYKHPALQASAGFRMLYATGMAFICRRYTSHFTRLQHTGLSSFVLECFQDSYRWSPKHHPVVCTG